MTIKRKSTVVMAAALILFAPFVLQAAENDPRAVRLVEAWEKKLNVEDLDITNLFTLVQKRQNEPDRVLRIRIYRRDREEAYTLIYLYPESEKGKGYLRNGDDLFQYFPSTREFVYRNRKEDIGGSDARSDLFGKQQTLKLYNVSYLGTAKVSKWDTDVVRLDAKELDVSFPIQKWYIRKTDGLPVKVENFSLSETLMRTYYYIDYEEVSSDKYVFTKLLAVNHLETGQKTLITIEDIGTDSIPDYTFTKAFLEEQSR
ncbi:MAG: outer membrane lipoprotein-sorting protein [Spirochaetes bacterium]|nr:outer membrane lipoprotein-sorting protein [Spirochaetota bacterium]